MGAVILLAVAMGLGSYSLLLSLPRFSPRSLMVARLGREPVTPGLAPVNRRLARWLRQIPAMRNLSVYRFRLAQGAVAGTALLLLATPWLLFGLPVSPMGLLAYPLLAGVLPEIWLWLQVRRRRALIARAYPDLLAHLAMQTRAGAGTMRAFASSPPVLREPLRSEVEELIADLRIAPFPAALERFAERCGVPEVKSFAQNVIYQQSKGISLPEVLEGEEAHAIAMAKQAVRQRIQSSAITMAAVTVILLLNGLAIYFTPVLLDLARFINQP